MYQVQYYSDYSKRWKEYISPSWDAATIAHMDEAIANNRMMRLQREWPRSQFRVIQLAKA